MRSSTPALSWLATQRLVLCAIAILMSGASSACAGKPMGYDFTGGLSAMGYEPVAESTQFESNQQYGWLDGRSNLFAVALPEGNYTVSIRFEDAEAAASSTVKAENRRLMLEALDEPKGDIRSFTVNVRRPEFDENNSVKLNKRETNPLSAQWDDRLTLELLPSAAGITYLKIEPDEDATTIFLAGDSTVTDQPREPWAGWGMMLPAFFEPGVAVANYAESGRALFSFVWEKRLEKILSAIEPGDYLMIQFGHNDQKDKRDGAGPFTTYKDELNDYIAAARKKKANPILVTPMERRRWSGGEPQETLTSYAEAMRQAGEEAGVPVIDLHAMSLQLYGVLGEEGSTNAFVHYPANTFPGQDRRLKDDTHHNNYGAYQLALCVVQGIKDEVPDLAKRLRPDIADFDPGEPMAFSDFKLHASQDAETEKPEGN